MMRRDRIFSAIDIGTSKICAALAYLDGEGKVNIIGMAAVPANGLWKGHIINFDEAKESFRNVIKQAEKVSGTRMKKLCVSVCGYPTYSRQGRYLSEIKSDMTIHDSDLACVLDSLRLRARLSDYEPSIHRDGRVDVITSLMACAQNTDKCLSDIGARPEHFIRSATATIMAVFEPDEIGTHPAVIDIGDVITHIVSFSDESPWRTCSLGTGGHAITSSIHAALDIPLELAEALKKKRGQVIKADFSGETSNNVSLKVNGSERTVSSSRLNQIITIAVKELLEPVMYELSKYQQADKIILTGGTSNLKGIVDLVNKHSRCRYGWADHAESVACRLQSAVQNMQRLSASCSGI